MLKQLVDLFHRMHTNRALTQRERAFIKGLQGILIGFVASLVPQIPALLSGANHFNLSLSVVVSLGVALLMYVLKLYTTQGDSHLSDLLDAYANQMEQYGLSQAIVPGDGVPQIPVAQLLVPLTRVLASTQTVPAHPAPQTPVDQQVTASVPIVKTKPLSPSA